MGYTKAEIYNLALGSLLLTRQTTDPDTDKSNEIKTLNIFYQKALDRALADMDLDATSKTATLALVTSNPDDNWDYSYTYPSDCVRFRRVVPGSGCYTKDTRRTRIPLQQVTKSDGERVIYTDEANAKGEYITNEVDLSTLPVMAGLAIAEILAHMAAPLVVGKGSKTLRDQIWKQYIIYKGEAQEVDRDENFNFEDPQVESDWVAARLE